MKHNIHLMKNFKLLVFFLLLSQAVFAQTTIQNSGWLTLVNNTKVSEKWGVAFDFQVRSADNYAYVRNILIRPGITYYFNNKANATVGYLYAPTRTEAPTGNFTLLEQRIWEQFIYNHKIKSSFATHRFRLEQRFIETNGGDIFAQRLRYFFRMIKPLQGYKETFDKGIFLALQDELFFNVQGKELLNNSLFDQNRFYVALGYRVSKKLDIEGGYLNQHINGASRNTSNRVAQLAVYTRF
jgi:hypothetical protein